MNKNILSLINSRFQKISENDAIIFKNKSISYNYLDKQSTKISNMLTHHGVKKGDIVIIISKRNPQLIYSIIGTLKIGAAFLIIDSQQPLTQINHMISQCPSNIILLNQDVGYSIPDKLPKGSNIIYMSSVINYSDQLKQEPYITDKDLVYVIFTSGSTGKPKGVKVSHGALFSLINSLQEEVNFIPGQKIMASSAVTFDMAIFELIVSLSYGLTIVLANEQQQTNVLEMINLIKETRVDVLHTTPSKLKLLIEADTESSNCLKIPSKILLAGEPFTDELFKKLLTKSDSKIYNLYGTAETTIYSTIATIDNMKEYMNIGRPLKNTCIYIVDDNDKVLPINEIGEIVIAGKGLSEGYIANEQSNKRFYANLKNDKIPYNTKLYKTGDIGRINENGLIECFGRRDKQIKINGVRIEPEFIEKALTGFPYISDAHVFSLEKLDNRKICAAIVSNVDINFFELREYLIKILPSYMIPSFYYITEAIPLTANGKVDENKVITSSYLLNTLSEYVEPRNEMEKISCEVWGKVLNSKVGITDNIFKLGGDSLQIIRISAELINRGIDIKPEDILKYQTVKDILTFSDIKENRYISKGEKKHFTKNEVGKIEENIVKQIGEKESLIKILPLTDTQKEMYIHNLLINKENFNVLVGFKIKGNICINTAKKSLAILIERNERLRTFFNLRWIKVPVQIELSSNNYELEFIDLTERKANIKKISDIFKVIKLEPIDITSTQLYRVYLIKVKEDTFYFLWNYHHLLFDALSFSKLVKYYFSIYESLVLKKGIPQYKFPEFSDYIEQLSSREIQKNITFWSHHLKESERIKPLNILHGVDYKPIHLINPTKHSNLNISRETTNTLKNISRSLNVSLNTTLQMLWAVLLQKSSNENDILFGVISCGRFSAEIHHNSIGMFINTIPVRVKSNKLDTFSSLVQKQQKFSHRAFMYENFPFNKVKGLSNQLDHLLIFHDEEILEPLNNSRELDDIGINIGNFEIIDKPAYSLNITFKIMEEINIEFLYDPSIFIERRMLNLLKMFDRIIKIIIENPDVRISEIDIDVEKFYIKAKSH